MFYLNLDNYLVFFLLLSTWTWDTFLTLRGTLPFLNLTLDWDLALGLSNLKILKIEKMYKDTRTQIILMIPGYLVI